MRVWLSKIFKLLVNAIYSLGFYALAFCWRVCFNWFGSSMVGVYNLLVTLMYLLVLVFAVFRDGGIKFYCLLKQSLKCSTFILYFLVLVLLYLVVSPFLLVFSTLGFYGGEIFVWGCDYYRLDNAPLVEYIATVFLFFELSFFRFSGICKFSFFVLLLIMLKKFFIVCVASFKVRSSWVYRWFMSTNTKDIGNCFGLIFFKFWLDRLVSWVFMVFETAYNKYVSRFSLARVFLVSDFSGVSSSCLSSSFSSTSPEAFTDGAFIFTSGDGYLCLLISFLVSIFFLLGYLGFSFKAHLSLFSFAFLIVVNLVLVIALVYFCVAEARYLVDGYVYKELSLSLFLGLSLFLSFFRFFFNRVYFGVNIKGWSRFGLNGLCFMASLALAKPSLGVLWDFWHYNILTPEGLFSTAIIATPFFTIRKRLSPEEVYAFSNEAVNYLMLQLEGAGKRLNLAACDKIKADLVPLLKESNFVGANELLQKAPSSLVFSPVENVVSTGISSRAVVPEAVSLWSSFYDRLTLYNLVMVRGVLLAGFCFYKYNLVATNPNKVSSSVPNIPSLPSVPSLPRPAAEAISQIYSAVDIAQVSINHSTEAASSVRVERINNASVKARTVFRARADEKVNFFKDTVGQANKLMGCQLKQTKNALGDAVTRAKQELNTAVTRAKGQITSFSANAERTCDASLKQKTQAFIEHSAILTQSACNDVSTAQQDFLRLRETSTNEILACVDGRVEKVSTEAIKKVKAIVEPTTELLTEHLQKAKQELNTAVTGAEGRITAFSTKIENACDASLKRKAEAFMNSSTEVTRFALTDVSTAQRKFVSQRKRSTAEVQASVAGRVEKVSTEVIKKVNASVEPTKELMNKHLQKIKSELATDIKKAKDVKEELAAEIKNVKANVSLAENSLQPDVAAGVAKIEAAVSVAVSKRESTLESSQKQRLKQISDLIISVSDARLDRVAEASNNIQKATDKFTATSAGMISNTREALDGTLAAAREKLSRLKQDSAEVQEHNKNIRELRAQQTNVEKFAKDLETKVTVLEQGVLPVKDLGVRVAALEEVINQPVVGMAAKLSDIGVSQIRVTMQFEECIKDEIEVLQKEVRTQARVNKANRDLISNFPGKLVKGFSRLSEFFLAKIGGPKLDEKRERELAAIVKELCDVSGLPKP